MAGKFVIDNAKDGQFYFNLKAGNGEIILTSEMYKAKASCINGIESVRKNASDESKFEEREAKNEKGYFVLKATNGQEIGRSQYYKSESGLKNGIASVMKNAPDAEIVDLTSEKREHNISDSQKNIR